MRDMLFRLRHRKSRREVVAFSMGMKVGRELAILVGATDANVIIDRITREAVEDFA